MSRGAADRTADKEVWQFTVCTLVIPAIALLGAPAELLPFAFPDDLRNSWIEVLLGPRDFSPIWVTVLALHGAVAAIAPVLGYTLLTSAAAPLAKIAPAGFVVAEVIQWRKYLQRSIGLLAGSFVAYFAIPTISGLIAAAVAAWYVLFLTYRVFKEGFLLLQDEPRFEEEARNYLKQAIGETQEPELSAELMRRRLQFSVGLNGLRKFAWGPGQGHGYLVIGVRGKPSQLLSLKKGSFARLKSFAADLGMELRSADFSELPVVLDPGTHVVLVVERRRDLAPDSSEEADTGVEVAGTKELQDIQAFLDELIQYGDGTWALQQRRVPMLVLGHLSVMLSDSMTRRAPHELRYGLSVLGDLIDYASNAKVDGALVGSDSYRWVYDMPASLVRSYVGDMRVDTAYSSALVGFLRGRLAIWLSDQKNDALSRAYLGLIKELLVHDAANDEAIDHLLVYVREIPSLVATPQKRVVVLVAKALIVAYLNPGVRAGSRASRSVLRAMHEAVSFSRLTDSDSELARIEVAVSLLAATMFLRRSEESYSEKFEEVLSSRALEVNRAGEATLLIFALLNDVDKLVSTWQWDWWEMGHKDRGEAHFMSMETWVVRSAAILLAQASWAIDHVEDKFLPSIQILSRLVRSVGTDWLETLQGSLRTEVTSLLNALKKAEERREVIVARAVAAASIDSSKCEKFVDGVLSEVNKEFGEYARWMFENGFCAIEETAGPSTAAVAQLIKRELFIVDDVLDVPIAVLTPAVARGLVEFETAAIGSGVRPNASVSKAIGPDDDAVWRCVEELLGTGKSVLVVGFGVYKTQVWSNVDRLERDARFGGRFKFVSSNKMLGSAPSILVICQGVVFVVRRRVDGRQAISLKVQDMELGGAVVSIASVTAGESSGWIEAGTSPEDAARKASEFLVFRVEWNFQVEVAEGGQSFLFRLPGRNRDIEE